MPVSAGVASPQLLSAQGSLSQFSCLLVGERLGPPSAELRVWGRAPLGAGLQQAHRPASGAKPAKPQQKPVCSGCHLSVG